MASIDPWDIIHTLVDHDRRDPGGRCRWCLHPSTATPPAASDHHAGCVFQFARSAWNAHNAAPQDVTGTLFEGVHDRLNEIVAEYLFRILDLVEQIHAAAAVVTLPDGDPT